MRNETWPEYLQRVTDGVPRKDIAAAADVDISGVSRWITGTTARPKAEKVVAFARGLNLNPVEALVAAGYLDAAELDGVVEVVRTRAELSDEELVAEVAARLARSDGGVTVNEIQEPTPARRIIRKTAPGKDAPMRGHEQRGQRHQFGGR
ncbi:helix-turn-helix domain-containing protein [Mycobacterium intracellulare]|uniref:helix-turn-helix domain-containing protein n=1 Tax=Mycobacterium intracellulare TaxID=1767 RepID=UPI00109E819A|nr:helix-turn-helix domain-containing protein [Mycobacterium intracellulare]